MAEGEPESLCGAGEGLAVGIGEGLDEVPVAWWYGEVGRRDRGARGGVEEPRQQRRVVGERGGRLGAVVGLEPEVAEALVEFVLAEELHEHVLVIAGQEDAGGLLAQGEEGIQDLPRGRPVVDVVAEEDPGRLGGGALPFGELQASQQAVQGVGHAVDIADDPDPLSWHGARP